MTRPCFNIYNILVRLVAEARQYGADELEIEYKDGREEVFACKGAVGFEVASFESSGEESVALRKQLCAIGKKGKVVDRSGASCRLTVTRFDSFGEVAFRVKIEEVKRPFARRHGRSKD